MKIHGIKYEGQQGPRGTQGNDGRDGADGARGPAGPAGPKGDPARFTEHEQGVFDAFEDAAWVNSIGSDVATTDVPTGTVISNPAALAFVNARPAQSPELTQRRVAIRLTKAKGALVAPNRLRLASTDDQGDAANQVASKTWVAINLTDPTYDYYYADPVRVGVGEILRVQEETSLHLLDDRLPDDVLRGADRPVNRQLPPGGTIGSGSKEGYWV